MKNTFLSTIIILVLLTVLHSCKKDEEETVNEADISLNNEINAGGYTFYQNGNTLAGVSPSPHGSFKLRFNSTALAALDSTGELPSGSSFPNGSVLVKDVYSGGNISLFAVMKKDVSNANAGSGWVWGEYGTDGSVVFSATNKGNGCTGCHSGSPNRDLTRTFDLH